MNTTTVTTIKAIKDGARLVSACRANSGYTIATYDDGFGPLWISRNSMGICGIVRAQTWEDAYGICEDEFFPEADESMEEIVKEYGFKRDHVKIIRANVSIPETDRPSYLGAYEKVAELSDYTNNGKLPEALFLRWETVETPDADAWSENELFCEGFGFRPNGPNARDTVNHGIYSKDLNGDMLDRLTDEMLADMQIELTIEANEDETDDDSETV